jgi:hypothetical protein
MYQVWSKSIEGCCVALVFQEVKPVILCQLVKVTWLLLTIALVTFFDYYVIIIIVFLLLITKRANKSYVLHKIIRVPDFPKD